MAEAPSSSAGVKEDERIKVARTESQTQSKAVPSLNPDLPFDLVRVPAVQEWIADNNSQVKPKKRLRAAEFLNDALIRLGERVVTATSEEEESVFTLLEDFLRSQRTLPRSTTLARLFFQWHGASRNDLCDRLMTAVLEAKERVPPAAFAASVDERVVTVALRALVAVKGTTLSHLQLVLNQVPPERRKRRVFFPLLQYAETTGDLTLAKQMLELSAVNGVELWDADFHCLLQCATRANPEAAGSASPQVQTLVDTVLTRMEHEHPVVGRSNAALIESLLGGAKATVDEQGVCSHCGQTLRSFELSDADRDTLLDGIVNGLIKPRVQGLSHYEPEKKVCAEEADARWRAFESFASRVTSLPYDTLIDGANVGYYGLNSWYSEAKTAQLERRGVHVPPGKHFTVPFPVDVAPKFELIDQMKRTTEAKGRKPLIVLHARHLQEGLSEDNKPFLSQWEKDGAVIASPSFLNDDYCWLYAAVARPHTFVVSNDQMRDHHFLALKPSCFIRWRQRHRITYRVLFHRASKTASLSVNSLRAYSVWVQRAQRDPLAHHWHVPFISAIDVLDQATNKVESGASDVELSKDGDDSCSSWVCTWSGRDSATSGH